MSHAKFVAVVFLLASAVVQASQCPRDGECAGDAEPQNGVSLLQTRLQTSVIEEPDAWHGSKKLRSNGTMSLWQANFKVISSKTSSNHGEKSTPGFVDYVPNKNIILCTCAKCGSTSVHLFMYQILFGRQWNYSGRPCPQMLTERWEGQAVSIKSESASILMENPKVFSLALVRDPRERLISAWKSKVACDEECDSGDKRDRDIFVPQLLALAGNTSQANCLSFPAFIGTLLSIHLQGNASHLNPHFLPQNLGCFKDLPVQKWSMVTNISDSAAAKELGAHLGNTTVSSFPHMHQTSTPRCPEVLVSETEGRRLDIITKAEYIALGMNPPTRQNDF